jgi:hypothetical protein
MMAEIGERRLDDSAALYEMANLFPNHTGLPFVVWILHKGGARHDVRMKVSHGPEAIPSEMAAICYPP